MKLYPEDQSNNGKNGSDNDENWYEKPLYLGGITAAIILVIVVVAFMIVRKRREEEYYGDWGDEEYYED